MASSDFSHPQEAEEEIVQSEAKKVAEEDNVEKSASDVNPKLEEGIQETAPLAELEKIIDEPKVEERAKEIALLVEKPKVEEGHQEIAPLDQPPIEEKNFEEGIQEIASLSQSSPQEKIVEKPKVEEEIAALSESSNDKKNVDKPKVEEGDDEIAPLAQSSTEEVVASLLDSPVEEKTDSEQKLQDRSMEPPADEQLDKIKSAIEESKPTEPEDEPPVKIEDVPVINAHGKDIQQVGMETDAVEPGKEKSGPNPAGKSVVGSVEEMPQEPEKIVNVPASSPADGIKEKAVAFPTPEAQTDEAKYVAISEALCKAGETIENPVVESVEGMPQESEKIVDLPGSSPAEAIQEKDLELPSPVALKGVAKDVAEENSEPSLMPQQSEQVQLIPEESPEKDEIKSSVEDVHLPKEVETSSDQEIAVLQVEERDVLEQKGKEQENTEMEGLPEAKDEEKIVVAEELVKEKITGGVANSPQEKAAEANVTSREIVGTKEAERTKLADRFEEEKRVDEQIKETAESTQDKLEEEVNEAVKTDIQVQTAEVAKDDEGIKTKEDVTVKTNKPSIVKMMKKSLVKAKKAIIGKSQNSKTQAPDGSK